MGITVVRDDCDARVWTDATKEALLMVSQILKELQELQCRETTWNRITHLTDGLVDWLTKDATSDTRHFVMCPLGRSNCSCAPLISICWLWHLSHLYASALTHPLWLHVATKDLKCLPCHACCFLPRWMAPLTSWATLWTTFFPWTR